MSTPKIVQDLIELISGLSFSTGETTPKLVLYQSVWRGLEPYKDLLLSKPIRGGCRSCKYLGLPNESHNCRDCKETIIIFNNYEPKE